MLPKMNTIVIFVFILIGCYAIEFRFPNTDPCMIIQMNGKLSLTMTAASNKTSLKSDAALDGSPMESSVCRNTDTPIMNVSLNKGSGLPGQITFRFTKGPDSEVSMGITYTVTPDDIFKNNDKMPQSFTIEKSIKLSHENSSFTCTASQKIKFNPVNSSGFMYDFKMHISRVQIQAFNIKNGTFSPAEDCTDVGVSTEGPTTEPPTQPPTTQPSSTQLLTTQPQPKNDTTTEAQVTTKMQTSEAPKTSEIPPTEGRTTEPQTTTQPQSPTTQNDKTTEASVTTKMQTSEAPKTSEVTTTVTTTEQPTTIVTTVVFTTTMVPEPTPKPGSPDTNTYTADRGNTTCLVLKAGIEFTVPYIDTGGAAKTVVVGIPKGFTVKGNCNGTNTTQSLSVSFYNNLWTLTMIFAASGDQFYMSEVDLNAVLDSSVIKDINNTVQVKINKMFENGQFSADKTGSYKCSAKITLTLDNKGFAMNTYNLQYAAFQTFPKNTTDFTDNNISDCSGTTTTNSVVPIAVGAALAGLVVIVLVAYLIGRRRRRASGYENKF